MTDTRYEDVSLAANNEHRHICDDLTFDLVGMVICLPLQWAFVIVIFQGFSVTVGSHAFIQS